MRPFSNIRPIQVVALTIAASGCRAKYVPNVPITGVDRPYANRLEREAADLSTPGWLTSFTSQLADSIADAEIDPSFAVFPALSQDPETGTRVNGMGTLLAETTARSIETGANGVGGVPGALVLSGDHLLGELRRAGLDPTSICTADDILQVAPRLSVSYLVYGTVNHTTDNALAGRQSVAVRWSCLRLSDGQIMALANHLKLREADATALSAVRGQSTNWTVCQ